MKFTWNNIKLKNEQGAGISEHSKPDRYNLNWQLCNEELASISKTDGLKARSIYYASARFFYGAIRSIHFLFKSRLPKEAKVLFFVSSENQYKAIEGISSRVKEKAVIEMCDSFSNRVDFFFPTHIVYWAALFSFKSVFRDYRSNSTEYIKAAYESRGDLLTLAPSLFEVAVSYLRKTKPKVVVVSNDLVLWTRAIIFAAKFLNIKTAYVQHACVSSMVPPLRVDYAFLDGDDAKQKYKTNSPNSHTEIYLTGGARHDLFFTTYISPPKFMAVGLCINMVDDIQEVTQIAKMLSGTEGVVLTIRPHPRERRKKQLKFLADTVKANWSDSLDLSAFDFISSQRVVIAGDSSILFDAALGGRTAITVKSLGKYQDYLGLVGHGLVSIAESDESLLGLLGKKIEVAPEKLRKYYAICGTPLEGKSGALISEAIESIANKGAISDDCWLQFGGKSGVLKIMNWEC